MINDNVLIIDNEESSLKYSKNMIEQFVNPENIFCTTKPVDAIRIMESKSIKLVFLDIDMPEISGFSLAGYIEKSQPHIKYVFLTGYANFAAESYNYEPLDFLTKPIDLLRLKKTLDKYANSDSGFSSERIGIDTGSGFVLLSSSSIDYIYKQNRDVIIKCKSEKLYVVHYSLDELEAVFCDYGFFRTHQSYLVPLSRIVSVTQSLFGKTYEAILPDGTKVPVSRGKYPKLREYLVQKGIKFV